MYAYQHLWRTKCLVFLRYTVCSRIKTVSSLKLPLKPTHSSHRGTRQSMVMLTLSPSDSDRQWDFYIWLKQFLPVLLWRVLHLVKSHYYGNVRVLEIIARWEQLDCLWHNNPTLSLQLLLSIYCIAQTPFLYTSLSLTHLYCLLQSVLFIFFICFSQNYLVIKMKHYHVRAFAVDTFRLYLKSFLLIYLNYCGKLEYLAAVCCYWALLELVHKTK